MQSLIDPGDLIASAWDNFMRNLRTYADFAVWYTALAVVQWGLVIGCRALFIDINVLNMVLLLVTIPVALATWTVTASLIDATALGLQGKPISPRASFSHGLHKLIPFTIVSLLLLLVFVFGFVLFIIPLFIFIVWYTFAPYFTVIDDVHGTAALKASHNLVRGRWWPVAIRLLLPAVFFWVAAAFAKAVAYMLIGFALGEPGAFFGRQVFTTDLSASQLMVMTVVPAIINAFAYPLVHGSYIKLWMELKKTTTPA